MVGAGLDRPVRRRREGEHAGQRRGRNVDGPVLVDQVQRTGDGRCRQRGEGGLDLGSAGTGPGDGDGQCDRRGVTGHGAKAGLDGGGGFRPVEGTAGHGFDRDRRHAVVVDVALDDRAVDALGDRGDGLVQCRLVDPEHHRVRFAPAQAAQDRRRAHRREAERVHRPVHVHRHARRRRVDRRVHRGCGDRDGSGRLGCDGCPYQRPGLGLRLAADVDATDRRTVRDLPPREQHADRVGHHQQCREGEQADRYPADVAASPAAPTGVERAGGRYGRRRPRRWRGVRGQGNGNLLLDVPAMVGDDASLPGSGRCRILPGASLAGRAAGRAAVRWEGEGAPSGAAQCLPQ